MSWKVKRASPAPRVRNVPVGVAFDDQGQLMIPHHDLPMPDSRQLRGRFLGHRGANRHRGIVSD